MQNIRQQENLQTLQCGRALAALAVVLFHANLTLSLPKYFNREVFHFFAAGFSGVYYFFVLSGTVMVLAHWDQIGRVQSPAPFFAKRFVRIYLPLWATLLLLLAPLMWMGVSLADIGLAFSGLPARKETALAIEWTLRHEILFYCLFGLLLWRPRTGAALLSLWYAGSVLATATAFPFPVSFILSPLHLLFAAGMLGALLIRRGVPFPGALAALGGGLFFLAWVLQIMSIPVLFDNLIWLYGAGSLLMIVGFSRLEISRRLTLPPALRAMGDASYALYLVHFPVVSLCCKLARQFDTRYAELPLMVYFVLTTAIAVVAGFIFHHCVEVPLVRWGRGLFVKLEPNTGRTL